MQIAPKLTPFLWFDGQAEEAATFYTSVFPEAEVLSVQKIPSGPATDNSLVSFRIGDQRFEAVDGGSMYRFTPAISFVIACDSQGEIDLYHDRLSEKGKQMPCGWVEDKFGLCWQVVPSMLSEIMEANPAAVMDALLEMQKIDIGKLREAAQTR